MTNATLEFYGFGFQRDGEIDLWEVGLDDTADDLALVVDEGRSRWPSEAFDIVRVYRPTVDFTELGELGDAIEDAAYPLLVDYDRLVTGEVAHVEPWRHPLAKKAA